MTTDEVRILLDAMIPGRANRWPAASDVIDAGRLAAGLDAALGHHAATVPRSADAAPAWLAQLAAQAPAIMRAVTEVVYAAYYMTPAVQAVIRELADSGPRDPSPQFDESLLAQVRARAAQQRRH